MRKGMLVLGSIAAIPLGMFAQGTGWQPGAGHTQVKIWPNSAPGAAATSAPEMDMTKPTDNLIAGRPLIRLGNVSVRRLRCTARPTETPEPRWLFFRAGHIELWRSTSKERKCA